MKIYIVTAGSYSDYQILKCFLKEEDVEDYASKKAYASVEIFDLEEDKIAMRQFWKTDVYISDIIKNSNSSWQEINEKKRAEIIKSRLWDKDFIPALEEQIVFIPSISEYLGTVTSYVSEEHCKKLAVELYQEWLRRDCLI